MKNIIIFAALLFVSMAPTVSAEIRADLKANIEIRRASSTERRMEMQVEIAKRKVANVKRVILLTIEHLEKIIVRIESRIEKIKDRGGDTTESEGFVALAKEDLADAKVAVEAFIDLDLSGNTAQENFQTIRAAVAEAKELIRSAHENLMKAVRLLGAVNASLKSASSTDETE